MEEKVYQGYVYRRSGPGQPWQQVGPAPARQGRVYTDPTLEREQQRKDAAERRAAEDQDLQRRNLGLSAEDNQRAERKEAVSLPQDLRKEYAALPEVREYKVAAQMAAAGLNTAPNPQGDIALTYSFAKAMDPGSVVRDQEANMVTNSQPWFQSAVENIKKQFGMDGAGNFTPEARARIRQEIVRALASRKPLYDLRRAEMTEIAAANGIPPAQVIGKNDIEAYAPAFRSYAEKNGDEGNVIAALIGTGPISRANGGSNPNAPRAAGAGAEVSSIPIPEEMQQAHSDYLAANWGKLDPQDYAAFRVNLDRQYGFGSDPEGYAKSAGDLNAAAAKGQQPTSLNIPAVKQELSGFDRFRNNLLSDEYGIGAGVASGLNAAGLGIPSLLAPTQMDALRDEYPIATTLGDIGGGLGGVGIAGAGLRSVAGRVANPSVASILANPLTADLAYGGAFGATQADDPLYGAAGGVASALIGNRVGRIAGEIVPNVGIGTRQVDEAVPSSQEVREAASLLYDAAENTGEQIGPPETFAMRDRMANILRAEGRLTPADRVTEVQPKVREAFQLASDYAGEPMTPKQLQAVRSVIGDAVTSTDNAERRIARLLLGDFDDWTDAAAPQMADQLGQARSVASRYLQGDEIALARDLADVRAGQFSNSGQGNALRTDFRQLDRKIARGQESFTPEVEAQIADVARGNATSNFFRNIGRFAPTSSVSSIPTLLAMGAGGSAAGLPGAALGLGLGGVALGAREIGQALTNRSAQVAENIAYAGQPYADALTALVERAGDQGGHVGAVTTTELARLLAGY